MGFTISIDKIDSTLLETLNSCPYCNSDNMAFIFKENGYPYFECKKCSLIFLKTRLKEENLSILYNNNTYHKAEITPYHYLVANKRLSIFQGLSKNSRIHEDGSGIGNFVAEANRLGFKITGSDLGDDSIHKAKELCNVNILKGPVQKIGIEPESLDAFAAFNLFSHLYEPWTYLSTVNKLLKRGGQFLTLTSNRIGFFRYLYKGNWGAPEHVYHFNVPLINKFLQNAGFELINYYPAFDSDFPYLFYKTAQKSTGLKGVIAKNICGTSIRLWNLLKLPKDDVYILAKKL